MESAPGLLRKTLIIHAMQTSVVFSRVWRLSAPFNNSIITASIRPGPTDARQTHEKTCDALSGVLEEEKELRKRAEVERDAAQARLSEQTVRPNPKPWCSCFYMNSVVAALLGAQGRAPHCAGAPVGTDGATAKL